MTKLLRNTVLISKHAQEFEDLKYTFVCPMLLISAEILY